MRPHGTRVKINVQTPLRRPKVAKPHGAKGQTLKLLNTPRRRSKHETQGETTTTLPRHRSRVAKPLEVQEQTFKFNAVQGLTPHEAKTKLNCHAAAQELHVALEAQGQTLRGLKIKS
jgi:hypothetical protein